MWWWGGEGGARGQSEGPSTAGAGREGGGGGGRAGAALRHRVETRASRLGVTCETTSSPQCRRLSAQGRASKAERNKA